MNDKENLFASFPLVSKTEWLEKVKKDLKGRPWSDLQWSLNEDLLIDPFYHADDLVETRPPLDAQKTANDWEIAERIALNELDYKTANEVALAGLMGGTEALQFDLVDLPSQSDVEILLQGIELTYISVHFRWKNGLSDPLTFLNNFVAVAGQKGVNTTTLSGSVCFGGDWDFTTEATKEWMNLVQTALPLFKIKTIDVVQTADTIIYELAQAIQQGSYFLEKLDHQDSAARINKSMQFAVYLDCSYFLSIASIRALKLLWANVLKAYEVKTPVPLTIEAHLLGDSQTEDQHDNMIQATTQAMSAVLAGVDRLTILPANSKTETATDFTRRIARNVQHLLKMETYLDRVVDPAAGSYYIEELTQQLAQAAWKRFQELETA